MILNILLNIRQKTKRAFRVFFPRDNKVAMREYYWKNHERCRKYSDDYYQKNKERLKARAKERRLKKKSEIQAVDN